MTVCERIDTILDERGMSRRKLAIKAGIAPSSLQSAMARNTGLSLDMLLPVADVLGLSALTLMEGEKQPNKPTICLILGVEVGEHFRIHGMDATFWIAQDGTFCIDPPMVVGASKMLLYALENPALVEKLEPKRPDVPMTSEEAQNAIDILEGGEWWNYCAMPSNSNAGNKLNHALNLAILALQAQIK